MKKILATLSLLAVALTTNAQDSEFSKRIQKAMESDIRTEAETDRDNNRRPVQTLEFFGVKEDMRVLELLPGGGWYTKLLAPALKDDGKLYLAIGAGRVEQSLLSQPGFEDVEVINKEIEISRTERRGVVDISEFELEVSNLDAVLTFRNIHNLSETARGRLNKAVYDALKPGGIYGLIDHTRRHMEGDNSENGRRVDPVVAIKELLDAGFEFEGYSNLHYRADDELRFEVGRKSVTGNSDRFTLLFKKPS